MPSGADRTSLLILLSIVVVDLIGFGIVMPILPFYAEEFGANGLELGVVLTGYAAMQFVFARAWGRLSDRIGRRRVLIFTVSGTCVSLLLLGLADSLVAVLGARMLAGVFAANVSVASAYITDATDADERTRWLGLLGACFAVGFLLGPAIGGLLAPFGHHVPMLFAAALAAANAVHAMFSLHEPPRHAQDGDGVSTDVLRDPEVRRICLTNLIFAVAVTQLESMFAFYMSDEFGFDARQVAFLLVGMAIATGLVQGGGLRPLVNRFGEKKLAVGGFTGLAVAFAAIPEASSVAWLLVPLLGSAFARGVGQPSLMGLASFSADAARRGAVMGTFQSAGSLARVVGPLVAGALYDYNHSGPFWLAAVAMSVAVLMALRLRAPAAVPAAAPRVG
jgi:MFS family permease